MPTILLLAAGQVAGEPIPTPEPYRAELIAPNSRAYTEAQIKAYNDKTVKDPELALLAVEMLMPDRIDIADALAGYGDQRTSERRLIELLAIAPDNDSANYVMATSLDQQGYHRLAVPYYRRASATSPDSYSRHAKAGLNAYFAGDWQACIDGYNKSQATGHPYAMVGEDFLKRAECKAFAGQNAGGDFHTAIDRDGYIRYTFANRMFEDGVFKGCKGSAEGKTKSAADQFARGKAYEAYRDVHIALQCDPDYIPAHELRIRIEDADNNLSAHAAAHKHVLANLRDGGQTDAQKLSSLQPASVAQMMTEASQTDMTQSTRNIVRVVNLATRTLRLEPNNWQARLYRARALTNLNAAQLLPMAWDDAAFVDSVAEGPLDIDRASVLHVRGILLFRVKMWDEALAQLNQAIALTPADMRVYLMRAQVYEAQTRYDLAVKDAELVLQYQPKNIGARYIACRVKLAQKDYAGARVHLQAIYAAEPGNRAARSKLIELSDLLGNRTEADSLHRNFIIEDEAGALADPYLKTRATAAFVADAQAQGAKQRGQAKGKAFQDRFTAYRARYSAASSRNDNLVARFDAMGTTPQKREDLIDLIDDLDALYKEFDVLQTEAESMLAADHSMLSAQQEADLIQGLKANIQALEEGMIRMLRMRRSAGGDTLKP